MTLSEINIYKIFHIENIPHILANGITHKSSPNVNPDFIAIGDTSMIAHRNESQANVTNGTNNIIESITPGDFTPFYFGVRMPMLYVVQRGGNLVKRATKRENIVYVACSVQAIVDSNLLYYFSDGHAASALSNFYNKTKINQLPQIVDWDSVKKSYWGGHENQDVKRKKQAEFLVKGDIPRDFIIGFGCYHDAAKQKLIKFGINNPIKVIPKAYY